MVLQISAMFSMTNILVTYFSIISSCLLSFVGTLQSHFLTGKKNLSVYLQTKMKIILQFPGLIHVTIGNTLNMFSSSILQYHYYFLVLGHLWNYFCSYGLSDYMRFQLNPKVNPQKQEIALQQDIVKMKTQINKSKATR